MGLRAAQGTHKKERGEGRVVRQSWRRTHPAHSPSPPASAADTRMRMPRRLPVAWPVTLHLQDEQRSQCRW